MALPALIPIMRVEDSHTAHVGIAQDGKQFMAFSTCVYSTPYATLTPSQKADWPSYRREYVVLHLFDRQGNYILTNSWFAGTSAVYDSAQVESKLLEMITTLGEVEYQGIKVKPFQTQIDGFVFGLLPDETAATLTLEPNGLLFTEPWDGEYYT